MFYKGVIFDFNGTMFWDTSIHNEAWDLFLNKYNVIMDDSEKNKYIHGKNNSEIFTYIFESNISKEQIKKYIFEKEEIYQKLCLKKKMELAPGLPKFLDLLNENKIKYTIATASGLENIKFFFDNLPIRRWFRQDSIVFNDGYIKSKPNPEIYLKAAKLIGIDPKKIIVFEDSVSGIESAENADIGKIIIVNSENLNYDQFEHMQIFSFEDVDANIFSE